MEEKTNIGEIISSLFVLTFFIIGFLFTVGKVVKKEINHKDTTQYPIECRYYSGSGDETINGICGSHGEFIPYQNTLDTTNLH